jgi:hypothetical protein
MPPKLGNVPSPLRWSVPSIGHEFGVSLETVRKRLSVAGEEAGSDGCFDTGQVIASLFGSINFERQRETKERADHWSLRNGALRGELLDKDALNHGLSGVFAAISQIIQSAPVPVTTKNDVLAACGRIPIVVRDVAARQRKQIHLAEPDGDEVKPKQK